MWGFLGMTHAINFVDDCELPEDQDFLFVAIPAGALIFYRESALTPKTLEDSWAAYRASSPDDDWGTPTRATSRERRPVLSLVSNA
jgi:hypothetical protein